MVHIQSPSPQGYRHEATRLWWYIALAIFPRKYWFIFDNNLVGGRYSVNFLDISRWGDWKNITHTISYMWTRFNLRRKTGRVRVNKWLKMLPLVKKLIIQISGPLRLRLPPPSVRYRGLSSDISNANWWNFFVFSANKDVSVITSMVCVV